MDGIELDILRKFLYEILPLPCVHFARGIGIMTAFFNTLPMFFLR